MPIIGTHVTGEALLITDVTATNGWNWGPIKPEIKTSAVHGATAGTATGNTGDIFVNIYDATSWIRATGAWIQMSDMSWELISENTGATDVSFDWTKFRAYRIEVLVYSGPLLVTAKGKTLQLQGTQMSGFVTSAHTRTLPAGVSSQLAPGTAGSITQMSIDVSEQSWSNKYELRTHEPTTQTDVYAAGLLLAPSGGSLSGMSFDHFSSAVVALGMR
jgi:hypothetical protein